MPNKTTHSKIILCLIAMIFALQSHAIAQTSFGYTGTVQTFIAPSDGYYFLQLWGAKGGNDNNNIGGNGGYAQGSVFLNHNETLYIYVGGAGISGTYVNGGFNGGGRCGGSGGSGSGGGASDIRRDGQNLSNRIIVAGGGGGAGGGFTYNYAGGGPGGGLTGLNPTGTGTAGGTGGTQTEGGTGNSPGILGYGGDRPSTGDGGGGGGGYYGGGAAFSGDNGGAGGSSFLGTTLNSLSVAGNQQMPNTSGSGTMTGNNGNGFVKITFINDYTTTSCPSNKNICANTTTWTQPVLNGTLLTNSISGMQYIGTLNGNTYFYVSTPRSWTNAKADAEQRNGKLAVIESQSENDLISNYLTNNTISKAWIGFSANDNQNTFVSITNIPLSSGNNAQLVTNGVYNNWGIDQPSNLEVDAFYTAITNANGKWINEQNTITKGYIIEFGVFQTAGLANGATNFPEGITNISYTLFAPDVTDVICSFDITRRTVVGDPTLFGENQWNVYGYNDNEIFNESTANLNAYYGYYQQMPNNTDYYGFNTTNSWDSVASTPSDAVLFNNLTSSGTNWQGCILPTEKYTFIHKRKGFDCGSYQLILNNWDDAAAIWVNEIEVWNCPNSPISGTCLGQETGQTNAIIGTYELDKNTTIEVRTAQNTGNSSAILELLKIESETLALNNQQKTCIVKGNEWVDFYSHPQGNYIVSIRGESATTDLGHVTATVFVDGTVQLIPACSNIDYQTAVMQRHWLIQPTTNGPAEIKLPYFQTELINLETASEASTSILDQVLAIDQNTVLLSKYSGPNNVNNSALDNCYDQGGNENTSIHINNATGVHAASNNTVLFSTFTINGFSEFWLHGNTTLTPLNQIISNFRTDCSSTKTVISWETISENNIDHFLLQYSQDGVSWQSITEIQSFTNNNAKNQYRFEHELAKDLYYRLILVDQNQNHSYQSMLFSKCNLSNSFNIYPNPSNGKFTIQINTVAKEEELLMEIMDNKGKIIKTEPINIALGSTEFISENYNLAPGSYIVKLTGSSHQFKPVRLVIQ